MAPLLRLLFILVLAACPSGCARKAAVPVSAASGAADPVKILHSDLDRIFEDQHFARAQLGVEVFSLDRAEILYEMNSQRLFIPASSHKLITAAVALTRLGPAFRIETPILTDGKIENGVLIGNLIIVGSGDPSHTPKFQSGDALAAFRTWAAVLKEKNIHAISGAIIGEDGAFPGPGLGFGWEWNDLDQGYAAPSGALQFNDNMLPLEILPGTSKGSPASIRTFPLENFLKINNLIVTAEEGAPAEIRIENGGSGTVNAFGTIPVKGAPVLRTVAVRNPTDYYLAAVKDTLAREGIDIDRCDTKAVRQFDRTGSTVLLTQSSPPLSAIIRLLMKESVNLYAETLVRVIGLKFRGEGSFEKGIQVVEETLSQLGIPAGSYSYADGSGLSRQNLESADVLVRVLSFMRKENTFDAFFESLPIAGGDGTLAERMKGTKAQDNVRAKTGTMTNVSSISGYVKTADGETLAFCILANNYNEPKGPVESMQDRALEKLAEFSRK